MLNKPGTGLACRRAGRHYAESPPPALQGYEPALPVRAAIESLVQVVLPRELYGLLPRFVEKVLRRPHVAPHADALWGDLSEREAILLACEVGLVGRDAIASLMVPGSTSQLALMEVSSSTVALPTTSDRSCIRNPERTFRSVLETSP